MTLSKHDAGADSEASTPYKGSRCCVGFFQCHLCGHEWSSVFSWANSGQICKPCSSGSGRGRRQVWVLPFRQIPKARKHEFFCVDCDRYIAESYRNRDAYQGIHCKGCKKIVFPDWEFVCDSCDSSTLMALSKGVAMRGIDCECGSFLYPKHMKSLNKKHESRFCQKCQELGVSCCSPAVKRAGVVADVPAVMSRLPVKARKDSREKTTTERRRRTSSGRASTGRTKKVSTSSENEAGKVTHKRTATVQGAAPVAASAKPRRKQVRKTSSRGVKDDSGFGETTAAETSVESAAAPAPRGASRGGRGGRGGRGRGPRPATGRARKPRRSLGEEEETVDVDFAKESKSAPTPKNAASDSAGAGPRRKKLSQPRRRRSVKSENGANDAASKSDAALKAEVEALADKVATAVVIDAATEAYAARAKSDASNIADVQAASVKPGDENNNDAADKEVKQVEKVVEIGGGENDAATASKTKEDSPDLKAGHPPALKVGGRRVSRSNRKSESESGAAAERRKSESAPEEYGAVPETSAERENDATMDKKAEGGVVATLHPKSPVKQAPSPTKPSPTKDAIRIPKLNAQHPIHKYPIQQPRKD